MGIKSDIWIRKMALEQNLIVPFIDRQVRTAPASFSKFETHTEVKCPGPVISYGLSSYGYDMRIAPHFKIFTNARNAIVDPKNFDEAAFVTHDGDHCIIPPNSFILGHSVEKFSIPRDILAICVTKSSIARCGLIVNVTPLEPGWCGYVTLEISNTTPLPAKVYANEGVAQLLFLQGDGACEISYADRQGKYQNQPAEVVLPKV